MAFRRLGQTLATHGFYGGYRMMRRREYRNRGNQGMERTGRSGGIGCSVRGRGARGMQCGYLKQGSIEGG